MQKLSLYITELSNYLKTVKNFNLFHLLIFILEAHFIQRSFLQILPLFI